MPIDTKHPVPVVEPVDEDTRRAIDEVSAHVWGQVNERCPAGGLEPVFTVARLEMALDLSLTLIAGLTAQGYKLQRTIDEFKRVFNETRMEGRLGN
jgi:hypothetical protein